MDIKFVIDWSKVKMNKDGSVIVGSNDVTPMQKFLGYNKPSIINGDFLLELLTKNEVKLC